MLNAKELAELVQAMRAEQKAFFAARRNNQRGAEHLEKSKALEVKVDRAVAVIIDGQKRLFE